VARGCRVKAGRWRVGARRGISIERGEIKVWREDCH